MWAGFLKVDQNEYGPVFLHESQSKSMYGQQSRVWTGFVEMSCEREIEPILGYCLLHSSPPHKQRDAKRTGQKRFDTVPA